jgi:hypothetical protein
MATYFELLTAAGNDDLNRRIRVAVIVAAEKIRTESAATPNNANRLIWARETFLSPDTAAARILPAVLAQNRAATLAAIIGADDATVQTAVDAAVNVFATGA